MSGPMILLAVLSLVAGFVETPHTLGGVSLFSRFLGTTLPISSEIATAPATELILQGVASVAVLLGLAGAVLSHRRHKAEWCPAFAGRPKEEAVCRLWRAGWGFDWLYDRLIVRPFVSLARINRNDVVDRLYTGLASLCRALHVNLSATQNGLVRRYAMGITVGAIIVLLIAAFGITR